MFTSEMLICNKLKLEGSQRFRVLEGSFFSQRLKLRSTEMADIVSMAVVESRRVEGGSRAVGRFNSGTHGLISRWPASRTRNTQEFGKGGFPPVFLQFLSGTITYINIGDEALTASYQVEKQPLPLSLLCAVGRL